jgi:FkbM family methyltransferase
MAIDSSACSEMPLLLTRPHKARSLTDLPSPRRATLLLDEIAKANCIYGPVPPDAPLALYGAGNLGVLARDFLKFVGQPLVLGIDRDAARIASRPDWAGLQLLRPDDVSDNDKRRLRLAVCVATAPYVPLERALLDLGFCDVVPFYDIAERVRHIHPLSNGWFAAQFSTADHDNIAHVLAHWSDDVSRAHHLQFLAWRRLREEWAFDAAPPLPNDNRFFIPEIADVLRGDEILLDAGAYHGTVTQAFVAQTKSAFRRIVAIEPDPMNRTRFEQTWRNELADDRRIAFLDCALSESEGEALFHDGLGYASQLSQTGNMRVQTLPLDALGISPTFIKLHLEGGELAALKGAQQTLVNSRPNVAVTVYHNDDGVWRTALWLMQMLADYRFLFRVHSWCGTGAVIYAIPNERSGR